MRSGWHWPGEYLATGGDLAGDGLLTAEDVTGMDLLDTELGVLAACETGLWRAFVLTGAKTLVMSLWKVPDKPTQELTVDFYERILRVEPWAEVLRAAQQALKERHPHPRSWGAFICQREPGATPRRRILAPLGVAAVY